ncbi:methionine synthase [uncultured Ilyobacter sp.]|uniref:methionine synthase n=1 Tax=uncultured Ilyobacter sp. TaxID=544433 RepID=UPI0029F5678A|nr:methionine synthase [uncultured Ilyobacter sp.]
MRELLKEKILILDGAMGTAIQNYSLDESDFRGELFSHIKGSLRGCNELLSLTKPEVLEEIHLSYLKAGADIIETNTFNSNRISMREYGLEEKSYDLSKAGAELAVKAARKYEYDNKRRIFVAGAMGPTSKSASIPTGGDPFGREVSYSELKAAYKEQALGLFDGGVDAFLIETIFDGLNAKAAVIAIEEVLEEKGEKLPIMISGTVDANGKLLSGQSIESLIVAIDRDSIISYGLNCSFGAKELIPLVKKLGELTKKYISLYPNAGLPNEKGEYDETPHVTGSYVKELIENKDINILGGCCGTTPEHIKVMAELAQGKTPRKTPMKNLTGIVSGNDIVSLQEGFLVVGERNNVSGSRKFARLIREESYDEALDIARTQVEKGAKILDINLDDALLDSVEEMGKFIRLLQNDMILSKLPIMLDSSNFDVIEKGLENLAGKGIVNSISLKDGEHEFLRKATVVRKFGAALVVMAFDEKGQAVSSERKKEICKRAYELLTSNNFPAEDIIFDPNVLTVGTGTEEDRMHGVDFIDTVKWIKENLPGAGVSGGVSNLSFAFRGNNILRHTIHKIFLEEGEKAGMTMAIVNPGEDPGNITPEVRKAVENLLAGGKDAVDEILNLSFEKAAKKTVEVKPVTVEERLKSYLLKGRSQGIEDDIKIALEKYSPLQVIQEVLMEGMEEVGALFEKGELFLPQILRSAAVMEKAVDFLTPLIEAGGTEKNAKGKVLMATVEGDVHDIGKNIVGTVLKCNGFDVVDLGVMVPKEEIMEAILRHDVDMVTLSGLITPSLMEMERVAEMMAEKNMDIPLLIGGAAASELSTAVRIEPKYSGRVIHVTDASGTLPVVSSLVSEKKANVLDERKKKAEYLRDAYLKNKNKKEMHSLEEARKRKKKLDNAIEYPKEIGKQFIEIPLEELEPLIDWDMLLHALKSKGNTQEKKVLDESKEILSKMKDKNIKAKCAFGIFNLFKDEDTLIVSGEKDYELPMVRSQMGNETISLADFFSKEDHIGAFVISVPEIAGNDEYESIIYQLLGTRLAEAASEWMEKYVNNNIWRVNIRPAIGYPSVPDHSMKREIFKLVDGEVTGAKLSSGYAMTPLSSVCGLYVSNPNSFYFDPGKISYDQLKELANLRGLSLDDMNALLGGIV